MKKIVKQLGFISILFAIMFFSQISSAKASASDSNKISTSDIISMVNSSRSQMNLTPLVLNSQLESAANSKAEDMFNDQYFAHVSPSSRTPWDFISSAGYNYVYAGENLAIGYDNTVELQNAWMNSPDHRENILNPNYREIGIVAINRIYQGNNTTIVVEEFGSKDATQPISQSVASASITPPSVGADKNSSFSFKKIIDLLNNNFLIVSFLIIILIITIIFFTLKQKKFKIII